MNVLVTGARAPIAADLTRVLAHSGHRVWLADSVRSPVSGASPFAQGLLMLPAPRTHFHGFAAELASVCSKFEITTVIPTSEEVFWLAAAASYLPASVDVRTSPLPVLAELHHKAAFARLAGTLGYGLPENHELAGASDLDRLDDPTRFVFKPVFSRFATRTLVHPTARELRQIQPSPIEPWLAQTRVTGRELCAYNVAANGRLLLHVGYEPRYRIGVGASSYFLPTTSEALRQMSGRFIQATGFTGQISFDAMETADGLVALECNPRGTSGVHLAAQQPAILAAALLGEANGAQSGFVAEPRFLQLPLLLQHPGTWLRADGRRHLRAGRDALGAAGISRRAQLQALAAITALALKLGLSVSRASTADIEWNGEPINAPTRP